MIKIRTSQFCALAHNEDWQKWLLDLDEELDSKLQDAISKPGCRKKMATMMQIYKEIYARGHGEVFEEFINDRFPYLIDTRFVKPIKPKNKKEFQETPVFKKYKPHLLTFPHKLIIEGDNVEKKAKEFIKNKLSADYIIVDNKAYVEYFMPHYRDVVDKIPPERREVHLYKMKSKNMDKETTKAG